MFYIIYILRNTINNKIYIGQTRRLLKKRLNNYTKNQPHIYNAIKKYGKNNFYYEVLTVAHTQEITDYWEIYFIEKYNSTNLDIGFNLKTGGIKGNYINRAIEKNRRQWIEKLQQNGKIQYQNNLETRKAFEENQFKPGHVPYSKGKSMPDNQYNKWLIYAF